jgi:hypothetical protein
MPIYEYTGSDPKGVMVRGELEAADHNDLVQKLTENGLFLVSFTEKPGSSDKLDPQKILDKMEEALYKPASPPPKKTLWKKFILWIQHEYMDRLSPETQLRILVALIVLAVLLTFLHGYKVFHPPEPWVGQIPPSG